MITVYFLTATDFIGRLHPLLVHLPVGILLLAILLYFLSLKQKFLQLRFAVSYSLLFGAIGAAFSCLTGFLLSQSGEYETGLVSRHQWLGISLTAVAFINYYTVKTNKPFAKWLLLVTGLLVMITGHLGGTLTHGEGYLTQSTKSSSTTIKPVTDVQKAVVYVDIIQPILQTKCYSCHSAVKQKGKLRLDEPSYILKGGETGNAINPGNISESELIKRILLPENNDDHMPPKSKLQLTQAQIELLHWWVAQGADFNKKTADLTQPEKIKPYLAALQTGASQNSPSLKNTDIPALVNKAADSVLKQLAVMNISVSPIAQGSNYLQVSFAAADTVTARQLQLLKQLSKQLIWLKLGHTPIADGQLADISMLTSLTRLSLEKTAITDRGLAHLNTLISLEYLNLSFTRVTENGLLKLAGLKNLKQLYLFGTPVTATGYAAITKTLPGVKADTGGYRLELLASDTMLVKAAPKK